MATSFNNFELIEDIVNTSYTDQVVENIQVLNSASNGGIVFEQTFVSGLKPEEIFWDDLANTNKYRDPETDSDQTAIEWSQSTLNSVKRFRLQNLVTVTEETLVQKRISDREWAARTGAKYAYDDTKNYFTTALDALLTTVENNTVSGSKVQVVDKKAEALKLSHFIDLIEQFDQDSDVACFLAPKRLRGFLKKLELDSKIERVAGLILGGGTEVTYGLPIIYVDDDRLVSTDIVGDSSNHAGLKILAIPRGAVRFRQDTPARQSFFRINEKNNLKWGVQGEYAYTVGTRGWSYSASGSNPSDTVFKTYGSWTKAYTADVKNLNGFLLQARNPAAPTL